MTRNYGTKLDVSYTLRLTQELKNKLDAVDGDASLFVRQAIEEKLEREARAKREAATVTQ